MNIVRPSVIAEVLGISERTIYRLADRGQLPGAYRFGRSLRIDLDITLAAMAGGSIASTADVSSEMPSPTDTGESRAVHPAGTGFLCTVPAGSSQHNHTEQETT